MRIGKYKWILYNVSAYEYKCLEQYLEDMALKGWKLKAFKFGFLCFEKIEPKALKYSVDFIDSIINIDGEDSDVSLEYREYCKAAGWQFICEKGKLQIYYSENEDESIPIHTDEKEQFKNIAKISFKNTIRQIILILLFIFNLYNIIGGNKDARFLAQNMSIATCLFTIIFIISTIIENINLVNWYIKNKINIKKNKEISYASFKRIKLRIFLHVAIIIAYIVTVGYLMFFEKQILLGAMLVLIIGYTAILSLFIKYINRKKLKIRQKRNLKIVGFIGVFIVSVIVINIVIFSLVMTGNIIGDKKQIKEYPITLSDFGDKNVKYENMYVYEDKSPIAYNLVYADSSDKNILMYDFFESKYKWAVDYDLYRIIKMQKNYGNTFKYLETLNGEVKVYVDDNKDDYIFVSSNKLIKIDSESLGLDEREFINIVYEKVFK